MQIIFVYFYKCCGESAIVSDCGGKNLNIYDVENGKLS